jgi:hypothetical protein
VTASIVFLKPLFFYYYIIVYFNLSIICIFFSYGEIYFCIF